MPDDNLTPNESMRQLCEEVMKLARDRGFSTTIRRLSRAFVDLRQVKSEILKKILKNPGMPNDLAAGYEHRQLRGTGPGSSIRDEAIEELRAEGIIYTIGVRRLSQSKQRIERHTYVTAYPREQLRHMGYDV